MLSIILQTNVTDITFRTMDVVLIVGGVISILTTFFVQRYQGMSNAEKIKTAYDEIEKLELKLEKMSEANGIFKKEIFHALEKQSNEIHQVNLNIERFKTEIIQQLNKK